MTGATVTTLKTQRNEKPGAEQGERQRKKESVAGGGWGGRATAILSRLGDSNPARVRPRAGSD